VLQFRSDEKIFAELATARDATAEPPDAGGRAASAAELWRSCGATVADLNGPSRSLPNSISPVHYGAAGGIAATFNAPITGVFFGVEIILREFSIEAIFTVMLSAMVADVISEAFLGSAPFLSGFPAGIALPRPGSYLLVAALAVAAALIGLAFKAVLYKTEDLCDRVWKNRPEWARPAAGGIALGLLLLAIPQLYGVGYPVMYRAVGGGYDLWFLIVLAAGKIVAGSLTIGIGGSGGVFAPSLFTGATSGMAFGEIAGHLLGPAAGQPALYAVVGMGAVFASAARAPLTSLASVVEMTGDFSLTLPVMLAVAIATAVSRGLSYGTIYTTKLLRRGTDIDRPAPSDVFEDMTVGDAMRRLQLPAGTAGGSPGAVPPGPVRFQAAPEALLAGESLQHVALRQLAVHDRDGMPVAAARGQPPQGWITSSDVIRALTRKVTATETTASRTRALAGHRSPDPVGEPGSGRPGYLLVQVTIGNGSPAAGRRLGDTAWPRGWVPVSVQDHGALRDADPSTELRAGDRATCWPRTPTGQPTLTCPRRHHRRSRAPPGKAQGRG
jgi:chloride channel protein, CIC family